MATPLDVSLLPKIQALIIKHGISASYTSVTSGVYNPDNFDPHDPSFSNTETSRSVITTPLLAYESEDIDGTIVQVSDSYVFMNHTNFTPVTDDTLLIAGQTWSIVNIATFSTGELVVCYKLGTRKGALSAD